MIRQVQEFYSGQTAEKVLYDVGGRLVTATEMLRGGHPNRGFVYAKYPNGLETWVNRSTNESWTVSAEGDEYVLPPNGHLALMPDQLLQYSALVDGHRADYSRGPHYTYMSGNGVATAFPELTAAGTYVLTMKDSGMRLTPAPFVQVETIKGLGCTTATPLGQDGKALSAAKLLDVTDAGLADLPVDGKAFAYGLE